jgi:hypothetical protein
LPGGGRLAAPLPDRDRPRNGLAGI